MIENFDSKHNKLVHEISGLEMGTNFDSDLATYQFIRQNILNQTEELKKLTKRLEEIQHAKSMIDDQHNREMQNLDKEIKSLNMNTADSKVQLETLKLVK